MILSLTSVDLRPTKAKNLYFFPPPKSGLLNTSITRGEIRSTFPRTGVPELPPRLRPKNSSLRTRAELDYLIELQASRTAEDVERIKKEVKLDGFFLGKIPYMEIIDAKKRPKTAALAKAVNPDIEVVMFKTKLHFNRVRPSILDPRIRPPIKVPDHPAYPSGHSTQAFSWAYLLFELTPPDKHEEILASATQIARNREIGGLHYPSDTALGKRIARQLVDMWMEKSEVQKIDRGGEKKNGKLFMNTAAYNGE